LQQEESLMDDIMLLHKQLGYRRWAHHVDVNPDEEEDAFDQWIADLPSFGRIFGVAA
jgi:hypothetical protein